MKSFNFRMSDDQGYADVGYHNPDCPIPTPNIDQLAKNGVRLENYYVHPTCSPTRASLLTGIVFPKFTHNIYPSKIRIQLFRFVIKELYFFIRAICCECWSSVCIDTK